jgi:hypothetical protein
MNFVSRKFISKINNEIKIVICREDLPRNSFWKEKNYAYENCWEIDEFFSKARELGRESDFFKEARRIFWEALWRLWKRYKGKRRFFDTYEIVDTQVSPIVDREDWILRNIVVSAMEHDIVPPEAKEATFKVYRELLKEKLYTPV